MVDGNLPVPLYDSLAELGPGFLLPNGKIGNGRLVFRTSASGQLTQTNAPDFASQFQNAPYQLFFFQPRTYVKAL